MKKLTPREQKIFMGCVVLICIYGGYNFLWKPFEINAEMTAQKIRKGKKRLKKSLKVMQEKEGITKQYEEYLRSFKQEKSDEGQMADMIKQVEVMTQKYHLQFSEMKPLKIAHVDFYNIFPMSLKMAGDLDSINQFIYDLQKAPYFFHVDKLRLEKQTRQKSMLKVSLILSKFLLNK